MDTDLSSSNCDRRCDDPDEDADQSVNLISLGFNRKLDLKCNDDSEVRVDDEDHDDCNNNNNNNNNNKEEEEEDDEDHADDDFTFMIIGDDDAPIYDDKLLLDQIRPAFPLFDQKLLLDGEYELEEIDRLPIMPPVDKIFIESPRRIPSSSPSETEQNDDETATGPYCAWSGESATATAELSKKSNSTGFSKLWRLKEKVGRSNSDGRDAFVFLKSSISSSSAAASAEKPVRPDGTFVKVNVAGGKARVIKQGAKPKKSTVSAHEAYLRSREHTEEERRRSYLPYRPELMGLFTNVHGGLTKNVHPY